MFAPNNSKRARLQWRYDHGVPKEFRPVARASRRLRVRFWWPEPRPVILIKSAMRVDARTRITWSKKNEINA